MEVPLSRLDGDDCYGLPTAAFELGRQEKVDEMIEEFEVILVSP